MNFRFPFFPKKQPILHLRHILAMGYRIELQAEAFYRSFSTKMEKAEAKRLCSFLAEEETRHAARIQSFLNQWNSAPPTRRQEKAFAWNEAYNRIFAADLPVQASWQKVLYYALGQEKEMVAFYSYCDDRIIREYDGSDYSERMETYNLWKSEKLAAMIAEEERHVKLLSELLKNEPPIESNI